ncbi:MAG: hypothetical protein SGCHY_004782 [Lobulomycetales sp.]
MPTGARNIVRSNDSASLWNLSLSPGWTEAEAETLRLALIKFGIGNWKQIVESGCLPGKHPAQLNLQAQRLLGQQSTGEFAGLHIDANKIYQANAAKQGPEILRKNGCIVNTGGKISREELRRRIKENKENYESTKEEWESIELPKHLGRPIPPPKPNLAPALSKEKNSKMHQLVEKKKKELSALRKELAEVELLIQDCFNGGEIPSEFGEKETTTRTGRRVKRIRQYAE